jgi:hypothetical protein
MARFCFNVNRKDAIDFLKTFYERVDVNFEIDQSTNESCIILNDKRDKDIFMNLSERLGGIDGFSQPSYVPKWKKIRHLGPYLPQYGKEPYMGAVLKHKNYNNHSQYKYHYKLSPEGEKAAFLYAALITSQGSATAYMKDQVFIDNYWKDFKTYLGKDQPFINFEEIDWSDVLAKYKKRSKIMSNNDTKYKHGFVEVDGHTCTATPFAADDMCIYFGQEGPVGSTENLLEDERRGRIRRAITAADVTLNLSSDAKQALPNIAEFKDVVYKPGMKWAAKWNHPITGSVKYMEILFSNPSDEEFVENFVEMYDSDESGVGDDDSDNESTRDYGDQASDDDLFGDIDDLTDDDDGSDGSDDDEGPEWADLPMYERQRLKEVAAHEESIPYEEKVNFENLEDEEINLPFSYIVSPKDQWKYVLDACKSGFSVVGNLGKVSNSVLRMVADAAAMALRDGKARVPELNEAFIMYAEQRGV